MSTMRPSSSHQWWDLLLVKQLTDETYLARIRLVFDLLEPLTGRTRPLGSENFTDHDICHSARIIYRLGQILHDPTLLTQAELYLLLLAALLHDAGMWVSHENAIEMLNEAAFLRWAENSASSQLAFVRAALKDEGTRSFGELGLQQLAASWGRLKHPERLGTVILADGSPTGTTLRHIIDRPFIEPLITVCVAHSWERREVLDSPLLDRTEIGHSDGPVRLRLVAALLRFGDLLDLGQGRISTLLWDYLRPLPAISEAHWRKEATLNVKLCEPHQIILSGKFEAVGGTAASLEERNTIAESYRLAREWIRWIDDELHDCILTIDGRLARETGQQRLFAHVELRSDEVQAPHFAFDGAVTFQLNRRRIIQLLGDEIYTQGAVFVRELLQNALDTTRAAILRHHRALTVSNPAKFPPDRPWDWPREIIGAPEWGIEVDTGKEKIGDHDLITFKVRDRGLGMTLDQIRNHFLQVGVSYYRTAEFSQEFRFPPISRFGIGFLSCLTVAARIEVRTRAASQPHGLRMTLQLPSHEYLVERDPTLTIGTTVCLWIDPKSDLPLKWSTGPMNIQTADELSVPRADQTVVVNNRSIAVDAITREVNVLANAVTQWLISPEVYVSVNGKPWGPREVTDISQNGFGQLKFPVQLPLTIQTEAKRILGKGKVRPDVWPSGVPQGWGGFALAQGQAFQRQLVHRGIFLDQLPSQNTFNNRLIWHASSLPRRELSAGRKLRESNLPPLAVCKAIRDRIYRHAWAALAHRDQNLAELWRYLVHPDIDDLPFRFPIRTTEGLEWITAKECISRHTRLLLVPMAIALKEPWNLPIPAMGLVVGQSHFYSSAFGASFEGDLRRSPLIEVAGKCTAILYPWNASHTDLPILESEASYALADLCVWQNKALPRQLEDGIPADRRLVSEEQLPSYDLVVNPWTESGILLPINARIYTDKHLGAEINAHLISDNPIEYPTDLLDFIIKEGDDWE